MAPGTLLGLALIYAVLIAATAAIVAGRRHGWVAGAVWLPLSAVWCLGCAALWMQFATLMQATVIAPGVGGQSNVQAIEVVLLAFAFVALTAPLAVVVFGSPPDREERTRLRLALPRASRPAVHSDEHV